MHGPIARRVMRLSCCGCGRPACMRPAALVPPQVPAHLPVFLQALADFMTMLGHDSARAFYGPGHVKAAHEMGAIQVCGRRGGWCTDCSDDHLQLLARCLCTSRAASSSLVCTLQAAFLSRCWCCLLARTAVWLFQQHVLPLIPPLVGTALRGHPPWCCRPCSSPILSSAPTMCTSGNSLLQWWMRSRQVCNGCL